jgi:hypothetical protein
VRTGARRETKGVIALPMKDRRGKTPGSPPFRITHLTLENWRNFTRVDVDLAQRVFLVGPNASGKSNLLDAIRFLRDVVAVGGGFREAVRRRGGVSRLRCFAARRNPDVALEISIGTNDQPSWWRYRVAFGQDNQRRPIVRREAVWRGGEKLLERPDDADRKDPVRLAQTHLEQVNVNQPYRGVVDFPPSDHSGGWRPEVAARRSPSLERALQCGQRLVVRSLP